MPDKLIFYILGALLLILVLALSGCKAQQEAGTAVPAERVEAEKKQETSQAVPEESETEQELPAEEEKPVEQDQADEQEKAFHFHIVNILYLSFQTAYHHFALYRVVCKEVQHDCRKHNERKACHQYGKVNQIFIRVLCKTVHTVSYVGEIGQPNQISRIIIPRPHKA